jgi:hypothetical protein
METFNAGENHPEHQWLYVESVEKLGKVYGEWVCSCGAQARAEMISNILNYYAKSPAI